MPDLIPDARTSSNTAARGLVRAGLKPALAERQRLYRAEIQRISEGGEPPAGWTRTEALNRLTDLMRGGRAVLRRIARLTPRNDNQPPPGPELPDGRARIRKSRPEATTGPPDKTTTAPLAGGAGVDAQRAKSFFSNSAPQKYIRNFPGASGAAEAEGLRASHDAPRAGSPQAKLEPGQPDPLREYRIFRDVADCGNWRPLGAVIAELIEKLAAKFLSPSEEP